MSSIEGHKTDDFIPVNEQDKSVTSVMNNSVNMVKKVRSKIQLSVFDLIALSIGTGLITIFTLGLAYPVAVTIKEKYIKDRTIISNRKLVFNGSAGDLYITYIKWIILVVITFGIYLFWMNLNVLR